MPDNPVRLQLSRCAGFNLQQASLEANGLPAVNVARPGPWGNPFVVGAAVDKAQAKRWGWWPLAVPNFVAADNATAVRRFAACLAKDEAIHAHIRKELQGKNLACWCKPGEVCDADALLAFANGYPPFVVKK